MNWFEHDLQYTTVPLTLDEAKNENPTPYKNIIRDLEKIQIFMTNETDPEPIPIKLEQALTLFRNICILCLY